MSEKDRDRSPEAAGGRDRRPGSGQEKGEPAERGERAEEDGTPFDHRRLDRLIHSRIRLAVLSILAAVHDAEFTYLRDQVNTTDGNLSTHLRKLEEAGYVEAEKSFVDRTPVTRYRLTPEGREAFTLYVERLESMLEVTELDVPGGGDRTDLDEA